MQYRRSYIPNATYFFTVVTYNRQSFLKDKPAVDILYSAFKQVSQNHPYRINALVILPDHLHTLWTLPKDDTNYPQRWALIKSHFTRNYNKTLLEPVPFNRESKGERNIWQKRYWEHTIRNQDDFERHLEYIHFNPVKHQFVDNPLDWEYSSLHYFVEKGIYPEDWGIMENKDEKWNFGE